MERLLGALEEFMSQAKVDLAEIKAEIKSLNSFKWKIVGASAVASVIGSILINALLKK
jgi:hypothetical protein